MSTSIDRALEKRARDMFDASRRGPTRFKTWGTITSEERDQWVAKATEMERLINERLSRPTDPVDA